VIILWEIKLRLDGKEIVDRMSVNWEMGGKKGWRAVGYFYYFKVKRIKIVDGHIPKSDSLFFSNLCFIHNLKKSEVTHFQSVWEDSTN